MGHSAMLGIALVVLLCVQFLPLSSSVGDEGKKIYDKNRELRQVKGQEVRLNAGYLRRYVSRYLPKMEDAQV